MKTVMDKVNGFFNPLRELPYGADGKYIHWILGMIAVALFFSLMVLMGQSETNLIGLSIVALFSGIMIERIQVIFFSGSNTLRESLFDVCHTWIGGTVLAYLLYQFGYIMFSFT